MPKGRPNIFPELQSQFQASLKQLFANQTIRFKQFTNAAENVAADATVKEFAKKNIQTLVRRSIDNGVVEYLGRAGGYKVK